MSNFINILEAVVNEGEQAEAYKKRKAAEAENKSKQNQAEKSRYQRRENIGSEPIYRSSHDASEGEADQKLGQKFADKALKDGIRKYSKNADKITGKSKDSRVRRDMDRRYNSGQKDISGTDYDKAYDASRRNARRHPQKEDYEFYNPDLI